MTSDGTHGRTGGPGTGAAHADHGNSVAAWVAVSIISLGFVVGGVAFAFSSVWLFWTGVALCALGVVTGKVLAMMGFGVSVIGHAVESATVGNDG